MSPFLEADHGNRIKALRKLLDPTMEESENGAIEFDRLCRDEGLHTPPHDTLPAFFCRFVVARNDWLAVDALKQIEVFVGAREKLYIFLFRRFQDGMRERVFRQMFLDMELERRDIFDEASAACAAPGLVNRLCVAVGDKRIGKNGAVHVVPVGSEFLRKVVHDVEEDDLHVSARIV